MRNKEIEMSKGIIIGEIIEYVANSVVMKTIIRKSSGNVTALSFDSGESLAEKISPFDTFIQVIEGTAEIVIDKVSNIINTGESIIIPAHAKNKFNANVRFKMISTTIKNENEQTV